MSEVHAHCWAHMKTLREQYLAGKGSGDIFECCYLTYLEVSEVSQGRDSGLVWDGWLKVIEKESNGTEPLNRHFGDSPDGRKKLAKALQSFSAKFHLPRRRAFTAPPPSAVETEEKPSVEPEASLDAFDLLFGDNEP